MLSSWRTAAGALARQLSSHLARLIVGDDEASSSAADIQAVQVGVATTKTTAQIDDVNSEQQQQQQQQQQMEAAAPSAAIEETIEIPSGPSLLATLPPELLLEVLT